jgi:chromosomal replication initiator protein
MSESNQSDQFVCDLRKPGEVLPLKESTLATMAGATLTPKWLRKKAHELLALAHAMELQERKLLYVNGPAFQVEDVPTAAPLMPAAILDEVAHAFRIPISSLCSKQRTQQVAFARQVAMCLIRKETTLSFPQIGAIFRRDHSTAIHAFNLIHRRSMRDAPFAATLKKIVSMAESRQADAITAAQAEVAA